jgi:hypothetical protein
VNFKLHVGEKDILTATYPRVPQEFGKGVVEPLGWVHDGVIWLFLAKAPSSPKLGATVLNETEQHD